jgi:streptogramin lyase
MTGTNRTIARRLLLGLLLTALVIAALAPAATEAAAKRAPVVKGTWSATFPERVHGTSVAVGSDGVAWFGASVEGQGPSLGKARSQKLEVEALRKEEGQYAETRALQFDSLGDLWFARIGGGSEAIVRRDPSGTVTEFALPKGETVTALTIGPEGDVWFTRSGYSEKSEPQVGRMTPTGAVTQFPLEPGSDPASITVGQDGAIWFSETDADKIGRITTSGEIQLFALPPEAEPRQIVSGPDGALWFGENAQARRYGRVSNRIGRITTGGEVTEFPVPFGKGTTRLAADPNRGVVWFATTEGEFSSISPSGNVGARGCVGSCGDPIVSLTLAPDGSLWFAAAHAACLMCGGGSDLMIAAEGTAVGQISSGALTPADPDGPPAVDPYANQTDHPPPPIARTEKPRELEATFAVFTGYINSRGYPATWLFRWGKTKKYGHKTFLPEFPFRAEEGAGRIGEEILGLCPGTTYHYEIIAWGPGGRALGGDRTFRTPMQKHIPEHCLAH